MEVENLSPLAVKILAERGIRGKAIKPFLYPDYDRELHDPWQLKDMKPAVARIKRAIETSEQITIYGDYDIDGLTATAIMLEALTAFGAKVDYYVPDRFEEGYGINLAALKMLKKRGTKLVVSVDCGVTAKAEVAWANEHDLGVIITDHHTVPAELPDAAAVINPKRTDDKYPFKELAGVGVAFKLVQALQSELEGLAPGQEKWLLDLVAMGTICDCVDLVGENRVLAKFGLVVLNKTKRSGLRALIDVAGLSLGTLKAYDVGFGLGPRLNAAGRLAHAEQALKLLITKDSSEATAIAAELNELNQARRADQDRIFEEANLMAEKYAKDPVLVLAAKNWSHGVVGIVASKLTERWHKPALVLQIMGETAKGSGRSFGQFDLITALKQFEKDFIKMGGHKYAAGFTLEAAKIDTLRRKLNSYYKKLDLPTALTDGKTRHAVKYLADITTELMDALDLMEPFGFGNPKPEFVSNKIKVVDLRPVGSNGQHLKLRLGDENDQVIDGIGFGLAERSVVELDQVVMASYRLSRNEFNGSVRTELIIIGLS